MGLLPRTHAARIAWAQNRIALWTLNATAVGTTTAAVTDVSDKADVAADALAAQAVAQDAAKAATETLREAMAILTNATMGVVDQVRVKARTAGNSVYPLANIPAPTTPGPIGPLGTPYKFKAAILSGGILELEWKCTQPRSASGTLYQVWRRIAPSSDYTYLGGVGEKKFTDDTVPAGTSQLTYRIQAARSTSSGPFAEFNVSFGVDSGGALTASVDAMAGKRAA